MVTESNISIIDKALSECRAALEKACLDQLQQQAETIRQRLIEHDWDLNAAYPYPSFRMRLDHHTSKIMLAKLEQVQEITVATGSHSRRIDEPCPVKMRPDLSEHQAKQAKEYAASFIDSYVRKMAAKVEAHHGDVTLTAADYNGHRDPFASSLLALHAGDKRMAYTTRCIINVSKYGKLFNQWPTRKA